MVELKQWLRDRADIQVRGNNGDSTYHIGLPLPEGSDNRVLESLIARYAKDIFEARDIEYNPRYPIKISFEA